LRAIWSDLSLDRRRAILAAVLERVEIHPQAQRGAAGLDPASIKVTPRD
jgi:hypothetical protein